MCVKYKIAGPIPAIFLFNNKYIHIIKKKDLFNGDFLKPFKTRGELTTIYLKSIRVFLYVY